jgi:hypothetical protein
MKWTPVHVPATTPALTWPTKLSARLRPRLILLGLTQPLVGSSFRVVEVPLAWARAAAAARRQSNPAIVVLEPDLEFGWRSIRRDQAT